MAMCVFLSDFWDAWCHFHQRFGGRDFETGFFFVGDGEDGGKLGFGPCVGVVGEDRKSGRCAGFCSGKEGKGSEDRGNVAIASEMSVWIMSDKRELAVTLRTFRCNLGDLVLPRRKRAASYRVESPRLEHRRDEIEISVKRNGELPTLSAPPPRHDLHQSDAW